MLEQSIENLEKSYLSSLYVISHSNDTVKAYKTGINRFRNFLRDNYQIDELKLLEYLKNEQLEIYSLLTEFVIYLDSKSLSPSSIKSNITSIKGYLRHLGVKINSDDLKQVKLPKLVKTREIPIDKAIILRLLRNAKPKLQLAILMATCTGMRVGELACLRISDIDFTSNPTKVFIRAETTKTRQSRECFLTTEATNALKDYIKRFHKWSEGTPDPKVLGTYIFGSFLRDREGFSRDSAIQMLQVQLMELIKSIPDLNIKNENGRASIHFHAFRKYFRTTVGNICGRDFAEAIIVHGFYMDTYYQLSEEKKKG